MQENQVFHPVEACNDGKINTLSGVFDLLNPSEDSVRIRDIADALSKICRFNGHITHFYSVAQHSVLVAAMAPEWCKKEALLHDAAEAYIGDIIKPFKNLLGSALYSLEYNIEIVIAQKFGLKTDKETKAEIKKHDLFALQLEHEAFQLKKKARLKSMLEFHDLHLPDAFAWDAFLSRKLFMVAYNDHFNL